MNTYKALVKIDAATTELTVAELENTFEGLPFVWVSDGGGKFSTQRTGRAYSGGVLRVRLGCAAR